VDLKSCGLQLHGICINDRPRLERVAGKAAKQGTSPKEGEGTQSRIFMRPKDSRGFGTKGRDRPHRRRKRSKKGYALSTEQREKKKRFYEMAKERDFMGGGKSNEARSQRVGPVGRHSKFTKKQTENSPERKVHLYKRVFLNRKTPKPARIS